MARAAVFVDTWALLALIDRKDPWHKAASKVSRGLDEKKRPLVTTAWVLTEFLNAAAKPPLRDWALKAVRQLQTFSGAQVIAAHHEDWLRGLALYESRADKEWSL